MGQTKQTKQRDPGTSASDDVYYLGIDPGQDKCGLAIVGSDRHLIERQIVLSDQLLEQIGILLAKVAVDRLILGNQTRSEFWRQKIQSAWPDREIVLVDERFSSQQARLRYWDDHPPQGWDRLLPRGMRTPPQPIDDIVAQILVERYLDRNVDA
ncbi:MAG: pre-16S rRNA-processing nuclease YqgF [Synechococcaceae cyanobacterium RM1_1_27]|nr:pre-16S rRNA-processing nuclease YqgF [Synechococcaceae cyanobacterium SM2_3_2]NJO86145.1 pre-16S rRNA-processing nuclease YqgF [Synechococcaceae cyanobacterium RM1_1_27]